MSVDRAPATRDRIDAFLQRLGRVFRGTGRLYLVGGTMMVYDGFRRKFAAFVALAEQQQRHN